jgi:microsomal prostaglandin-E synthase 2
LAAFQLKPDVRESLYDDINFWLRSIKAQKTTFMGGDRPDLADLAVYGVLSAIEGQLSCCLRPGQTSLHFWKLNEYIRKQSDLIGQISLVG